MNQNENDAKLKKVYLFVTEGEEHNIRDAIAIEFLNPINGYADMVEKISILKDAAEEIFEEQIEVNVDLPENINVEILKQMGLNT